MKNGAKRFRVALSFAGENRAFVARLAESLAVRLGKARVLYDRFHEAEFATARLAYQLPELYKSDSDLIVAILCRNYESKEWCGLEWDGMFALIKQGQEKQIMLCRFDRVEPKGLHGLAGFVELDERDSDDAARLVLERLALVAPGAESNDGAPSAKEWPREPPPLEWPMADHRDAQEAFAKLITRDATFRLLPIRGASGTGKSHLTKQFHSNALHVTGLACGRLDFKGSTDIQNEVRIFSDALEIPAPPQELGLTRQLGRIFDSLRAAAVPTLLIFDTFEGAGDAERWVKETLLLFLAKSPWLRVIVVGQRTTHPHGEAWARWSSPALELRLPTPEDWFLYGREHKPAITLDLVRTVHGLCNGESTVLAQVFGPPRR